MMTLPIDYEELNRQRFAQGYGQRIGRERIMNRYETEPEECVEAQSYESEIHQYLAEAVRALQKDAKAKHEIAGEAQTLARNASLMLAAAERAKDAYLDALEKQRAAGAAKMPEPESPMRASYPRHA